MSITQTAILNAIKESKENEDKIQITFGVPCYPIRKIGTGMYVEKALDGAYMVQGKLAVRMARKLVEDGKLAVKRESAIMSDYLLWVIPTAA